MQKSFSSDLSATRAEVEVKVNKVDAEGESQQAKSGPVELDSSALWQVSGGVTAGPNGNW